MESHNMSLDDFNVILEIDNIGTIKNLVRREIGASILSRSVCLDELKKGSLSVLPIENLSMVREINILYHRDFRHEDLLQTILKEYNKMIKNYSA
jgi:DNA-binding transcriptional LysR family regulator